jgi:hypothetical protein
MADSIVLHLHTLGITLKDTIFYSTGGASNQVLCYQIHHALVKVPLSFKSICHISVQSANTESEHPSLMRSVIRTLSRHLPPSASEFSIQMRLLSKLSRHYSFSLDPIINSTSQNMDTSPAGRVFMITSSASRMAMQS